MRPILNIVRLIFGDLRMAASCLVAGFPFGCTIIDQPTAGTAAVVGLPLAEQSVFVDARNQFGRVPA